MTRRIEPDGQDRRWVSGVIEGASTIQIGEVSIRLLRAITDKKARWDVLGRVAGRGIDQVSAEVEAWLLVDSGLARVHERRTRRGDWEPYQWEATAAGAALVTDPADPPPDVNRWLAGVDSPNHPVLSSIRLWITANFGRDDVAIRLVMAIGDDLRAGRTPRGRLVALAVGGHTKAVRLEDHRDTLEDAFGGFALEDVVRLHGRAVLASGDFRFRVGEHRVDARWSRPWIALTPETLSAMVDLDVRARRLLTIENLVAFEEEVRAGVSSDTLVVYTSGFPGSLERAFLQRAIAGGVEVVDHWGDIDVGGFKIYQHLCSILPVPVHPYRMGVDTLDRLPTRPITERDRLALTMLADGDSTPFQAVAAVMLERGVKAEQEGWFLR